MYFAGTTFANPELYSRVLPLAVVTRFLSVSGNERRIKGITEPNHGTSFDRIDRSSAVPVVDLHVCNVGINEIASFLPFDPWTTRMQPSPSWSSLPVHRAGTPIRRWFLPPLVALYQRLQHLESAGGPLKPGFGLSGDVQIHRLSPPNRLDCPHAMGTDAFTAGGIISSLSPVTTVGMAKWKVGGHASHESSRWMEYLSG